MNGRARIEKAGAYKVLARPGLMEFRDAFRVRRFKPNARDTERQLDNDREDWYRMHALLEDIVRADKNRQLDDGLPEADRDLYLRQ